MRPACSVLPQNSPRWDVGDHLVAKFGYHYRRPFHNPACDSCYTTFSSDPTYSAQTTTIPVNTARPLSTTLTANPFPAALEASVSPDDPDDPDDPDNSDDPDDPGTAEVSGGGRLAVALEEVSSPPAIRPVILARPVTLAKSVRLAIEFPRIPLACAVKTSKTAAEAAL